MSRGNTRKTSGNRIRKPDAVICSECGRQFLMFLNQNMGCPKHPHAQAYIRKQDLIQQEDGITQ